MVKYKFCKEEKEYLKTYDIAKYDRPSVTADIAVFAVREERQINEETERVGNYRKDPENELQILLVKRASYPFRGDWALPGGFAVKGESCEKTARRELAEETGVSDAYLRPFGVFGDPERDPRGWIISHAYLALIDGGKYRLHAATDAWEAAWFCLELTDTELSRSEDGEQVTVEIRHDIRLYQNEQELELRASVCEKKRFSGLHGYSEYEITDRGGLAFDHAQIILEAFLNLRKETESTGDIVFDLMPERFTLARLQRAYELVLGRELLTANFRRKIAPLVLETEEEIAGVGHRPAKLYRRNPEKFYN